MSGTTDYPWYAPREEPRMSERDQFEYHLEQTLLHATPRAQRKSLMRRAKQAADWVLHCGSQPSSPEPQYEPIMTYRASGSYPTTTVVVQNTGYIPPVNLTEAYTGPAPSTTASSSVHLPVVPQVQPLQHHPDHMPPPLPIIPQYMRSSPRGKPVNPWLADDRDNVLDSKHLPTSLADVSINIHPKFSTNVDPFPLIVDLRLPRRYIWNRPKPGYDETPELWKGHNESATLPRLNSILLLSPLFDAPVRVDNENGVNCGDVVDALFNLAHAIISEEQWKGLPYLEKQEARSLAPTMRSPAMAWSALEPHQFVYLDTWHGHVTFIGLRRDPQYVKKRMGWAKPACFIVELSKPIHCFRYE